MRGGRCCVRWAFENWGLAAALAVAAAYFIYRWIRGAWRRQYERAKEAILDPISTDYDARIAILKADGAAARYFLRLQAGLNWFSAWLGDDRRPMAERAIGAGWQAPPALTGPAYLAMLSLAFFYPIAFCLLSWSFGGAGELGGLPVLPADMAIWRRWGALGLFCAAVVVAYWGGRRIRRGRWLQGVFAFAVAFAGAVAAAVAALAQRYPKNKAIWGPIALIIPGLLLLLFALDGSTAGIAITDGPPPLEPRPEWWPKALPWRSEPFSKNSEGAAAFVLFLAVLPALNAVLDWVSLGVSRKLLGKLAGPGGHSPLWLAIDLALAVAFFFLVSWIAIAGLGAAERLHALGGASPVIDVSAILDGVRTNPASSDYAWIYLMIATTLLPTLVHAYFALGALSMGGSPGEREELIRLFEAGRGDGQTRSTDAADEAARRYASLLVRGYIRVEIAMAALLIGAVAAWFLWPPFSENIIAFISGAGGLILDVGDAILSWIENDWNGWPFIW